MINSRTPIQHVLIVDDDIGITESLQSTLKIRFNIDSTALNHTQHVLQTIQRKKFDAVILDLMLPETDGIQLCQQIRQISNIPVIMITASEDVHERLFAFKSGVDDFLVKPFNTHELIARIEAIHRRLRSPEMQLNDLVYAFERWEFDTRDSMLHSSDTEVPLSTADAQLLKTFLEHPNRILSRDFLLDASKHKQRDVYDRSIDVRVGILRKKIEKNPKKPTLLLTQHGQGYILNAPVQKKQV